MSTTTPMAAPNTSRSAQRSACERCRSHKLRCTRRSSDDANTTCLRCARAGSACITGTRARSGRPRTKIKTNIQGDPNQQQYSPDDWSDSSQTCDPSRIYSTPHSFSDFGIGTLDVQSVDSETLGLYDSPQSYIEVSNPVDPKRDFSLVQDSTAEFKFESSNLDDIMFTDYQPSLDIPFSLPTPNPEHTSDFEILDPIDSSPSQNEQLRSNAELFTKFCQLNDKMYSHHYTLATDPTLDLFSSPAIGHHDATGKAANGFNLGDILTTSQEYLHTLNAIIDSAQAHAVLAQRHHSDARRLSFFDPDMPLADKSQQPAYHHSVPAPPTSAAKPQQQNGIDPALLFQVTTCYVSLLRIYTHIFARLLAVLDAPAQSCSSSSSTSPSSAAAAAAAAAKQGPFADVLPNLQIGSFNLYNGNLQLVILVQVLLHTFVEIERVLGVPGEFSLCGSMMAGSRKDSVIGVFGSVGGLNGVFVSLVQCEERRGGGGGGGVGRLKELIGAAKKKLGPGAALM
ncbi:hypothetical protein BS50DRAFT_627298 [Corynespora cassiicola Philippines]|uniref:Zn(2)-C6 fungal-type domain-containing protein n=1 Tax=Corynespora cassiicola Philippines TaxID=1448308 RepID=A0A2T2P8E0_CORCC|nr:hypothetical protein BS50DRAFT_627298 [Corynespora cassiicola Philippines]